MSPWRLGSWVLGLLLVGAPSAEARPAADSSRGSGGVVVESVGGGSLEKAGLRPGDLLLTWKRLSRPDEPSERARGEIVSVFDWLWLELEEAPRGAIELTGTRGDRRKVFRVSPGKWEASVRPRMSSSLREMYQRGRGRLEGGEVSQAAGFWEKAATTIDSPWHVRCWMWLRVGELWSEAGEAIRAQAANDEALENAREPLPRTVVWRAIGALHLERGEIELAGRAFESARRIREQVWGESLALAEILSDLVGVAWYRKDMARATYLAQRVQEIREKLAPKSLIAAASLDDVGVLAWNFGEPQRAAILLERALEIRQELAPDGLEVAESLTHLGLLIDAQKDSELAMERVERALEIRQELLPGSLETALSMTQLGILVYSGGDWARAAELHQRALEIRREVEPDSQIETESLRFLAGAMQRLGSPGRARELLERALEIRQKLAPNSLGVAEILSDLGVVSIDLRDMSRAENLLRRALEMQQELAPGGLEVATSLRSLGLVAQYRGDLGPAEELFKRALKIHQERLPGSSEDLMMLNNLGSLALDRGDLERARDFLKRALAMQEERGSDDFILAGILANLGNLAYMDGDSLGAGELLQQSLKIQQEQAPESLEVAKILVNLGMVALSQRDLARATDVFQRALAIQERLAPESLDLATTLNNLGIIAWDRRDLQRAWDFSQRALAIRQNAAPGSLVVAQSLVNLGSIAEDLQDPERSMDFKLRALAIQEKSAPDSLALAQTLNNLGTSAKRLGNLDLASELHERSLEIRERLAPGSPFVAQSLANLGYVAWSRGDFLRALDYFRRGLDLQRHAAPESVGEARILHALGSLHSLLRIFNLDSLSVADEYFRDALAALDHQLTRLGGAHEVRSGFRAHYQDYYRDTIEVQMALGEPEIAFHTLERSRARGFLEQLSERDIVFAADLPEELDQKRRRLAARYDRNLERFLKLDSRNHTLLVDELADELRRLRDESRDLEAEIRRASPRLAALRYPEPLDFSAARSALDPGTLMLSYSVADETTLLMVVSRDRPLETHSLPIGRERLRSYVEEFHQGANRRGWRNRKGSFLAVSTRLYEALLSAVEPAIEESRRLLILPDGPLHRLPFAALVREGGSEGTRSWRYLVESKPVHSALSATVYSQLKKSRRASETSRADEEPYPVVVFGDPNYSRRTSSDDALRSSIERGLDFRQLPYTRQEAESIAELYPGTRTYLGSRATEERAKAIGKDARIVHFATHGHLDDRFPAHSALVLTLPEELAEGRDNGLLQTWEIFERVRLDADLVVLSACGSGLGDEKEGEGLIGLTRAFQYAGARTVIATLWNAVDRTTAVLMERFYRHLRAGRPKDEALRAAQLELIRGPVEVRSGDGASERIDASAPFYWAAFQVYGDWR